MAEASKNQKKKTVPGLRVISKRDGFRRGGREWVGTTEVDLSEFSKKQIEQIRAEKTMLVVEDIELEVDAD